MPDSPLPALPPDLPAAEDLLRVLLDVSQSGIVLLRPLYEDGGPTIVDLAWVHLNPAAQQMLRLPQRPAESLLTLFPTAEATGTLDFYREAFLTGREARRQNHYSSDGLDGTYVLTARRQGDVLVVSVTEASSQSRSAIEQELRASQANEEAMQRLRLLTDSLPVLIAYLDREQRYQFVNHAYRSWFNYDPAALVGRTAREVVGSHAYANVKAYIERALAGERLTFEARMPYRAGFERYIHTDYIPDVHQGKVRGFYSLVTDITEQTDARQQVQTLNEELAAINEEMLSANEELRDTNERLSHTNVDLDTFVYTASHDLRAPIANIEGLLTALEEQLPPPVRQDSEVTHLLELMRGSVYRFQRTLVQLTDVSKLQQAHTEPAEAVDLAAVVESLRLDLAPALEAADGQLLVEVGECPTVRFSPKNLRSILYNLLSNAIKYHASDRPARVRLRATCLEQQVRLEVQDNGLGLTAEEQGKLFVMFRRLHTHVDGTGVGLYMVKRMVENAGGTIQVESTPGVGSTFTVLLPARDIT